MKVDPEFGLIIMLDGVFIRDKETIAQIAKNDGFDRVEDFIEWFKNEKEPFSGQLIHWTDFKY